jgi:anti-anti-sigma factor
MNDLTFSFSDTIAGYVKSFDAANDTFLLETSDGREFNVALTSNTFAEIARNLDEPYVDATGQMQQMLTPGRFLYAYGPFFPESGTVNFEAKHIVFVGRAVDEYIFLRPDFWAKQCASLSNFYYRAEWGNGPVDFRNYRTTISLGGVKGSDYRQETDTISRMTYGFASAYLLSGDERFLEAAEAGTDYLRDHFRFYDSKDKIVYWFHAIDVQGEHERKVFASEFGDDYDAIPMYEQIYALAGPMQTYRITGDPRILQDAEMTINLFDKYYIDRDKGGYFSHIDPVTLDPRAASLGPNRARKNWNSVGDHAPAYLVNLWLATGEDRYADFLEYTFDTIEEHFPDYENSPFVNERFHEDWSHDQEYGWQQNRAVVGHNLKIAWNLMRMHSLRPKEKYVELAKKIADLMPDAGSDRQRGGWYDVVERTLGEGQEHYRFVWHDRKAWWQQEQAILAYLILAGCLGEETGDYMKHANEASSFYNAWFLDHDEGGVYFNVLANGLPYLLGTERFKGSHSMGNYHASELCYLAATYQNLLLTKDGLDLYFKPLPNGFKDRILRVQPDILPVGSIKIDQVWIDDKPHADFDSDALTVKLPDTSDRVRVKVRIVPAVASFTVNSTMSGEVATVTVTGNLDDSTVVAFDSELDRVMQQQAKKLVIDVRNLEQISSAGFRALVFVRQKLPIEDTSDIVVVGARGQVKEMFDKAPIEEEIRVVDSMDDV